MNTQQQKDLKECEEAMQSGKGDKECLSCSCNRCIAQLPKEPSHGLLVAIEIIDAELVLARQLNPQMAMGMLRIKDLIKSQL